jgi:FKBP-type peptidyl-prolyl cis-trans isomerase FkpA
MKSINIIILSICLVFILFTSCNPIDTTGAVNDWKIKNASYFTNMKDSAGYVHDTIAAKSLGSRYYYKITTPGVQNSISPVSGDQVTVNYRGKLVDGSVFDQTYTKTVIDSTATPRTFYDNQLIPGWTYNLLQMKVGETRKIVLPMELAYGATGSGAISPYSTTIWVVQLIKVIH